jgi:predicted dehydrogenase
VTNLRVALVGAGLMGYWHGHAIKFLGERVMAIVDSNLSSAERLAQHHSYAQVYGSLETALQSCPVDVVHICTPLNSHVELIQVALQAGCHVLAEKPLTSSFPETELLLDLANQQGLKLNSVHQFPFESGFINLLEQRKQLGEIVRFSYSTCSAGGTNKSADFCRSILLEILPHPISLIHHFFKGNYPGVFDPSLLKIQQFTDEDLELSGEWNNTHISILLSLRGRPTSNELRIIGTKATAYIDLFHGYGLLEEGQVSRQAKIIKPFQLGTKILINASSNLISRTWRNESAYPGLRELIKRFYDSILTNNLPPISIAEMLTVAQVIDYCKKSSE